MKDKTRKIINSLGIAACVAGCAASLVNKNYVAVILWILLLLQDLRSWKLEDTIEIQKDVIDLQKQRTETAERWEKVYREIAFKGEGEENAK